MDRASDSGSEGWGFESLLAYQKVGYPIGVSHFLLRQWDSKIEMQMPGGHLRRAGWTALHPYRISIGNSGTESLLAGLYLGTASEHSLFHHVKRTRKDSPWESPSGLRRIL